jgi:hypothetical protein
MSLIKVSEHQEMVGQWRIFWGGEDVTDRCPEYDDETGDGVLFEVDVAGRKVIRDGEVPRQLVTGLRLLPNY